MYMSICIYVYICIYIYIYIVYIYKYIYLYISSRRDIVPLRYTTLHCSLRFTTFKYAALSVFTSFKQVVSGESVKLL